MSSSTIEQRIDEKEKQKHFILTGNLWKVMADLSWPAIVAMVLYGMNSVLDAFFVGHYVGEAALAGVSVAYPLSQISVAFGSLIGAGAGAVLSIAIGSKDHKTQERLLGNVNFISVIVTVLYMVLGLIFSTQLISIMGGRDEALLLGDQYFRITVFGAFFWVYGLAGNMIIRAEGKMKTAAAIMGIGLAVDAVFKYLFIAVFQWGVEGAAWATNIGMLVYTLANWVYFSKGWATFPCKLASIRWDKKTGTSILRLGMSSLIMSVMSLVQAVFVFNALANYGTTADVAFYGVVYRIFTFLLTPIFGLMRALQPVIGINYGAKQYDRVIRSYAIFSVTAMLLTLPFWILSLLAPGSVLGMMMKDTVLTNTDFLYFRIYMAVLPILSFIFMAMTLFPSVDKGKPAALIGIARQLVFYVPVMIFLPGVIGVSGIYYGSLAIDAVIVIATLVMVRNEFASLRKRALSESTQLQ